MSHSAIPQLEYRTYVGADILPAIEAFAGLRIAVFRDWPYLYAGDLGYELEYLQRYAQGDTILIAAYAGDDMVGAATAMPLSDHADDFAEAFRNSGVDFNDVFYCAESVLLSAYRGQGAGHVFFDLREAHAKNLGFSHVAFCSVVRGDDHRARPLDYRPLDAFWRGRGYAPIPDVIARFSWRDLGDTAQTPKALQFWMRSL